MPTRLSYLLKVIAASAAIAAAGFAAAGSASAATRGTYVQNVAATSGSWGAASAANGSTPTAGSAYTINWNLSGSVTYQYFQVVNTGTLDLAAQTYSAVNSKPTNGNAPPTIELDACIGASWNTTTGTCAGTKVVVTATNQSATAANIAIAAGASVSFRALPITLPNYPQPYTTTVSISVARNQARTAATYNG